MFACEYGRQDVVKLLLDYQGSEKNDLSARDNDGWTLFMITCKEGHQGVVLFRSRNVS